jgi:HSP20 family protein
MAKHKTSFFERLTGAIRIDDIEDDFSEEDERQQQKEERHLRPQHVESTHKEEQVVQQQVEEMGELTIDMYENSKEIIIKSIVAGVRPEDLDISITREMVTITGKREGDRTVTTDDYFHQELYWGSFSRSILLPQEIDTDEVEAVEKHGLLIIKLPKLNKDRQTKVRVKSH